jgi:hypothetical protein
MIGLSIKVHDGASGPLRDLRGRMRNPMGGLRVAGRAVANLLKRYFVAKNSAEPNKLGGKRTNFWLQIRDSVQAPVDSGANSVIVSIADPRFCQKVYGGEITAKRAGALTIPVHPAAHGRRASVLEQVLGIKLHLIRQKSGGNTIGLLVGPGNQGTFGFGEIFYVLVKSVTQGPTPGALPPEATLIETARAAFAGWANRLVRKTA